MIRYDYSTIVLTFSGGSVEEETALPLTDLLLTLLDGMMSLEDQIQALKPVAPEPQARPLSFREAGRLLGLDRNRVPDLVKQGTLRAVPWGKGLRIPRGEVERLARSGYAEAEKKGRRTRVRGKAGVLSPAEVQARLDEF